MALNMPNGLPSHLRSEMTLTVLGCGTLGIAILSGILASLSVSQHPSHPSPAYPDSGTATPTTEMPPSATPSKFIACVRRPESAKRIKLAVAEYGYPVQILQNENVKGVKAADVVILGCKPYMVAEILAEPGIREALEGKLLISICAGVPVEQIQNVLYPAFESTANPCRIVRVMPNTAAIVRESMTVIATSTPALPPHFNSIVEWIFKQIGRVVHLPSLF